MNDIGVVTLQHVVIALLNFATAVVMWKAGQKNGQRNGQTK